MGTKVQIRKATHGDLDRVVELYDAICDYLDATFNYPGWTRGDISRALDGRAGVGQRGALCLCRWESVARDMHPQRGTTGGLPGHSLARGDFPGWRFWWCIRLLCILTTCGRAFPGICCGSPNNMPKDMESAASAWTSMNGMSPAYASMNGMATMLREKPICIWATMAHKFPVVTKRSSIKEKDYADQ